MSLIPERWNAPAPIVCSEELESNDTLTRAAVSANASLPIDVTLDGIVNCLMPED